jgi:adenylate cyclase
VTDPALPEPGSEESLARWNLTPVDLEKARTLSELALLAIERGYAGSGRRYDIDELAAVAGVDGDHLRMLWRSLGFTEPQPGDRAFSDSDLIMLAGVIPFLADDGMSDELALQMTRVLGSAVARIANAQVDAIVAQFDSVADEVALADRTPEQVRANQVLAADTAAVLDAMPNVIEFVWRRHLVSAAGRRRLRSRAGDVPMCVGFADLVGFTAQTQRLTAQELAEVVERFEKLAFDVVSRHGGRVVKMIGDEVLFVADDIVVGARIAVALSEAYRDDESLSDVRVGLAAGTVLERDGDVYGPVVNLANRIVVVAFPGSVVVSSEVAEVLADEPSMVVRSIRSQPIKDIGTVPLYTLRPVATPEHPARTRSARHHLRDRQAQLSSRRHERQRRAVTRSQEAAGEAGEELAAAVVGEGFVDDPTGQIEAITEAVLAADIDHELQVGLLADIDAARRLHQLEDEAAGKADEVDAEVEARLVEVESDARRRVEDIEAEARRRVETILAEAERKMARVAADAERRANRVADEVERQAERVERDAERQARRRIGRTRGRRQAGGDAGPGGDPGGEGGTAQQ